MLWLKIMLVTLIVMVIALFPFWIAMLIHWKQGVVAIDRVKFSLLSAAITYGIPVLITILTMPLVIFKVKIAPQFGSGEFSYILDVVTNSIGQISFLSGFFLLLISVFLPYKLSEYFNRMSDQFLPTQE